MSARSRSLARIPAYCAAILALSPLTPVPVERAEAQATTPSAYSASGQIDAGAPGPVISRDIFAQFAEHLGAGIYGGIWVGPDSSIPNTRGFRNDVVDALKKLEVPLIRWPGGCFADVYHWRDGIGPIDERPARPNSFWETSESNRFGTHEFMDFVELIGSEAYINGNVGSSHPGEMAEWVEYMTASEGALAEERARNGRKEPWRIAYWGIGNELWGCGGDMRAEYAADLTRRFRQFLLFPNGMKPQMVASGPNIDDYPWTETMMRETGSYVDALALHYYTIPDRQGPGLRGSGTDFDEAAYARTLGKTLRMDEFIAKHSAIMDRYDPEKRVNLAVDEWGILTDTVPGRPLRSLYMQNSLRDAILASLNFDIFIKHADRVRMTSIAQMINVAQSMILTDGADMILTPTYHAFEMYRPFQGAVSLPLTLESPQYKNGEWEMRALSGSAARAKDGGIHVALTNVEPNREVTAQIRIRGAGARSVSGRILHSTAGFTAHNDFPTPAVVAPAVFTGASIEGEVLRVKMPPHSIVVLELR